MNERIEADLKEALLARDQLKVSVLRSIKAALINERISEGSELIDSQILAVLKREAKKRQEAIDLYSKAGQADRAKQESDELEIIAEYLPQTMSEAELAKEVELAIDELKAGSVQDMGRVMGHLTKKLDGRADNSQLAKLVRDLLSSDN